ncbi:MAG: hypothetical protein ACYTFQ_20630 [Planctomycetota bacterium]|jgi:hypothetical protein
MARTASASTRPTITVTLLTKEQAEAPRRRGPGKAKGTRRTRFATYHGRPATTEREKRQLVKTRTANYAVDHGLYIGPWIPGKGHQSVASVVSELRELHARTIHVPDTSKSSGVAMAFYSGRWHRIMMLEERVHVRRLRGAWGLAQPGYMVCDCCFFRTDSRELQPVAVGKSNATLQEFHVCVHCLNEGALARTSAAGYVVKRME